MPVLDLAVPLPEPGSDVAVDAEKLGFRFGDRGTHTSRTIMFTELGYVLGTLPPTAGRGDYAKAIIDDNLTGKRTVATRKLTNQRLGEFYGLDSSIPVFRLLRRLWDLDRRGRPLLALLAALARDPLLRASAPGVLPLNPGAEFSRQRMTNAVREAVGARLNDSILDKVVRNAASSWTQSGHLRGRVRKHRERVQAPPVAVAYALLLGYLLGLRGHRLFTTLWTSTLDARKDELIAMAAQAKRQGLLNMKYGGGVIEIDFDPVLTAKEREQTHGPD